MPRYTDKQIIHALKLTNGMVYVAADNLGCSPNTVKKRLLSSQRVAEAQEAAKGQLLDVAETRLAAAVARTEPWAVQFYLKTQGRCRGYGERKEISGPDGGPMEHSGGTTITVVVDEEMLAEALAPPVHAFKVVTPPTSASGATAAGRMALDDDPARRDAPAAR